MRWRKPNLRNSLFALLGHDAGPSVTDTRRARDEIRLAMLQALSEADPSAQAQLLRRVAGARDLQEMWYLRSDLMGALAFSQGELVARQRLDAITRLFRGLLPEARPARTPHLTP